MESWCVSTTSCEQTEFLAALLGEQLNAGSLVLLCGDLGAGKTCFTRGLARGLGVAADEPVNSPSYNLMNLYPGRFPIYHFDFYRLSSKEDLDDIDYDYYARGEGVTVVEWADRFGATDTDGLRIDICCTGEEDREFFFSTGNPRFFSLLTHLRMKWR